MKHRNILFSFLFILFFKYARAPPLEAAESVDTSWTEFWVVRLVVNLLGYASLVVPAYFVIQYLKRTKYNETGSGLCLPMVKTCVFGADVVESMSNLPTNEKKMGTQRRTFMLLFCAGGLQLAYLTWGVIQERIMTKEYGKTDSDPGEKFTNSQFLVFVNRSLACMVAGVYIFATRQPRHNCPFYKFSYSSFSNIMSSWFQYEALKFVAFPTQVMGKACKVIPVMLMGKVVSGNVYQLYEWITAGMLSLGITIFLLAQGGDKHTPLDDMATGGTMTTASLSGLVLMLGYMAFDSFTSNWQGKLFKVHKMSSVQMMFGVNLFSCIFTSCSLLEQGGFFEAFYFMGQHVEFVFHSVVLSICSAVGQLFIFYTISEFGAVVFTIIMTMRQAFAILLSCLIFGHPVGLLGVVGIFVVFSALFLRIYARSKVAKKQPAGTTKV